MLGAVKRVVLVTATFALALAGLAPALGASTPRQYYLALGDSLVYGIQPAKVDAGLPPSGFHTGFVDVFAARLRAITPHIRVVNYGCPGESTKTFVGGGCPWLPGRLHDPFRGTQLDAAVAFLRAHPGQVSPITLTLFGNDVAELAEACHDNGACIRRRAPKALAQFGSRLTTILHRLRTAAPDAVIVVTGGWNFDVDDLKTSDPLVHSANAAIARSAAAAKARLADLARAFNPPGLAARKARLCWVTFICSAGDPHPTDAGYRLIGKAVFSASGFR